MTKIRQILENDKSRLKLLDSFIKSTAYNLLTTIPFTEHDFYLNKTTFWDSICICYDILQTYLPWRCVCGQIFNVKHALFCKKGGFITLPYNELRDFTGNQLSEVCHDVQLESQLKPLTDEIYHYNTSIRVDVSMQGFWVQGQLALSDVGVINLLAKCYNAKHLKLTFATHEEVKKRSYNQKIIETGNGSFSPLVFACTGGILRECWKFYSRLVNLLAIEENLNKSTVMGWLRANLWFKSLRSVNICIWGSRSRNFNEMKKYYADDSNDIKYVYSIIINEEWIVDREKGF